MTDADYDRLVAQLAICWRPHTDSLGTVHGDDVITEGNPEDLEDVDQGMLSICTSRLAGARKASRERLASDMRSAS